ncbi:MAG: hypothetical protein OEN50_07970 [Deltaproteobacteria bacterium]|nr:hypothetical protein [Deltaproteobacteria bacterium]
MAGASTIAGEFVLSGSATGGGVLSEVLFTYRRIPEQALLALAGMGEI